MRFVAMLVAVSATASVSLADLPSPRLDRIFPVGASAGTSVEIEVAGAELDDAKTLVFDHPGLSATHIKDRKFLVKVAGDVAAGTYDVRVVGKYGVSSPRLFLVSRGVSEILKKGKNHDVASAQVIAVNTAVHGQTDGNREDFYRFPAKKGQRIVVECQGQHLDSQLDGTLTVTESDGKPVASNGDHFGRDPLVDFVASHDGDYLVSLSDLTFRGGYPYRLLVTDRPHVETCFPRVLQAGKPARVTVYGRNLGGSAKPSAWKLGDLPLDSFEETTTAPGDILQHGAYRFTEHPSTHSVLPSAATSRLVGFQYVPKPGGEPANPQPMLVVDTPVSLEVEPNDEPGKAQTLPIPAVVAGRFDRPRDADWFTITPDADGPYGVEVFCERIAGRADPYVVILDEKENRVAEFDDGGPQHNAFYAVIRDPVGVANLRAKQKYRVLVQDRYGRGGVQFQYVLAIRKATPDFFAAAIHRASQTPGGTTLRRGGTTYVDIVLQQQDGFNGPVTITAENLPRGVHAAPSAIFAETRAPFVLWADADAPEFVGPIKLYATGKVGDREIRREVRAYTRVLQQSNQQTSRPTREQVICVLPEPAPFSVRFEPQKVEVEAGKTVDLRAILTRNWPDFKAPVTLAPMGFPGAIQAGNATIPEAKSEGSFTLRTQPGTKPGEYTLTVSCQGQVPFSKDPKNPKGNTLVDSPSFPITVVVTPPPAKPKK